MGTTNYIQRAPEAEALKAETQTHCFPPSFSHLPQSRVSWAALCASALAARRPAANFYHSRQPPTCRAPSLRACRTAWLFRGTLPMARPSAPTARARRHGDRAATGPAPRLARPLAAPEAAQGRERRSWPRRALLSRETVPRACLEFLA